MGYVSQHVTFATYSDGENAKDFNITASAYAFVNDEKGNSKNDSITLTAHRMNVTGNVYWYTRSGSTDTKITDADGNHVFNDFYTATAPNMYVAKILSNYGKTNEKTEYEDVVTIGEVQDGATGPDGKPAISIMLSNPTMTFNTSNEEESESCEVMVYEGGTKLLYGTEDNNGRFLIYAGEKDTVQNSLEGENKPSPLDSAIITIRDQGSNGNASYTVIGRAQDEKEFVQELTIYWTVVRNGNDVKDLNLHTDTYFVTKKKNGTYSPTSLTFTAQSSNLSGDYTWKYGTTEDTNTNSSLPLNNTSTLTYPLIVSVSQDGLSDSVTITLIDEAKDGEDAIGIALSNPAMTFNTSTSTSETCSALVVKGTTEISYSSGVATSGSDWYYTLENSSSSDKVTIDNTGLITVSNPGKAASYDITITVYCGNTKKREATIPIHCTSVINGTSAYSVSLDNDSDTLVISSADGQWISSGCTVNATKYLGSDIAADKYLTWSLDTTDTGWVEYTTETNRSDSWNYKITPSAINNNNPAELEIRTKNKSGDSILNNFTEATFTATCKNALNGGTTYATKKFSVKVLSSLADYDLIVPQIVFNKKDILTTGNNQTVIPISVQKKSKDGTEILSYSESSPVRVYTVTKNIQNGITTTTYTKIDGDWNNAVKFSSKAAVHVVLGSTDGGNVTENDKTINKAPSTIWDEEIIEVVEDGARGPQGSSGLVFSLDNDNDVFVKKKDGTKISGNILVTAQLTRDGKAESDAAFKLESYPKAFEGADGKMNSTCAEFDNDNGKLTIKNTPDGFESGGFVFKANDSLTKTFTLRVVQSNVDYDLCFDKTVVNSSTSGSVQVWVNKTDETGKVTRLDKPETVDGKELVIYVNDTELTVDTETKEWPAIEYSKGENTSKIVTLKLGDFEWDNESIEFIHDAPAIRINSDKLQFNVNSNGELYDTQNATLTLWGRGVDVDSAVWHTDGAYLGEGSVIQVSPELFDSEIPDTSNIVVQGDRLKFLYAKNGRVFTGGTKATIYYTTNNAWSSIPHLSGTGTKDIMRGTYFKGKYYIVTYNGYLYVFDEEGYNASNLSQLSKIEAITTNGKVIIAVGQGVGIEGKEEEWPLQYLYSTNGANWETGLALGIADTFTSICLTNDGFFACGNKTNTAYLINEDGTPKQKIELPAFKDNTDTAEGYNLRCVYYNNGKYFIGQHQKYNSILVGTQSSSGIEWTSATIDSSYSIRSITYFNGLYWAFGYKSGVTGNVVYCSSDGSEWKKYDTTDKKEGIWCSTIIDNHLYYAGENGNITKFQTSNSIAITAAVDDVYDTLSLTKVYDGAVAQDFSVTASAYAFVQSATNPVTSITLKADLKNLNGEVKWYKGNSTTPIKENDPSFTIDRTTHGADTYTAKLYKNNIPTDWEDSVTIGLVSDGATGPNGKPAISISLSNPTMVFNSKNTTEKEECKVIVYEGATTLTPGTGKGKFSIVEKDSSDASTINEDTITITNPCEQTTKNYTVKVYPSDWVSGDPQESDISINCTLVDDGEDGVYTSLQADPAVIHSTDLSKTENYITFTAYEKVGGKETKPLSLTTDYSYKYKWDNQSPTTVSFTSESSEFKINATHSGSPKTLKVELYKSSVLIASQTVEVLYDVARREYFLYHDATTTAAPELPTELDWRKFREKNSDTEATTNAAKHKGWYQTQDKDDSYYYISKRNAYDEEEQAGKPWFGPMEIKQTPQTYDSWWKALDNATKDDKTKGIYTLKVDGENAVGMNADFIKTGALKICPKKFKNNAWVDEPTSAVFETGWEFKGGTSTDLNDAQDGDELVPYVKIGGVDFTGYIPGIKKANEFTYVSGSYNLGVSNTEVKAVSLPNIGPTCAGPVVLQNGELIIGKENAENREGSFGTDEVYYRFMKPTANQTYLKPGQGYRITGKVKTSKLNNSLYLSSIKATKTITKYYIMFRYQSHNGSTWYSDTKKEIFEIAPNTDSSYLSFDQLFTVPIQAKGFYFSFQLYCLYSGITEPIAVQTSGTSRFTGQLFFKDLVLTTDNLIQSNNNFSWKFDQDNGLYMWKGAQTTTPVMKVDSGGLELTGKIYAEAGGSIGGWEITDASIQKIPAGKKCGDSDTAVLQPGGTSGEYTVGGHKASGWVITAGPSFGVTKEGALYASKGTFGYLSILKSGELLYENQQGDTYEKISLSLNGLRCMNSTGESATSLLTSEKLIFDNSAKSYINISNAGIRLQMYKNPKWNGIDITSSGIFWYQTNTKGTQDDAFFSMEASSDKGLIFGGNAMSGVGSDYKSLKGLIGKVESAISLAGDVESQLATASMNSSAAVTTASEAKTIASNNKVSTNNAYTFYAIKTNSSGKNEGIITFTVSNNQITNISYV